MSRTLLVGDTTPGPSPSARSYHSATAVHPAQFDTARVMVFGGWTGKYFYDELHVLSGMEDGGGTLRWSRPRTVGLPRAGGSNVTRPEARAMHSATVMSTGGSGPDDPPRTELVVFGGWAGGHEFLNDTWALDIDTLVWRFVSVRGAKPRPRAGHSAVAFGRQLAVFGGAGPSNTFGELWVLDMAGGVLSLDRTSTRPTLNLLLLLLPLPITPRVCMSIHPEGKSCSNLGRVLVLNDPRTRTRGTGWRCASAAITRVPSVATWHGGHSHQPLHPRSMTWIGSPPSSPRVCMSVHPECQSCSDIGSVHVLNDPAGGR
jgi:hypothetical protein